MTIIEDIKHISRDEISQYDYNVTRNKYASIDRITNLELEINELKKELKELKDNLYEVMFNDKKFANDK